MGIFRIVALSDLGKKEVRESKTINTPVIKCIKSTVSDPCFISFNCKMPLKYCIEMATDIMNINCKEGIDYKIEVVQDEPRSK